VHTIIMPNDPWSASANIASITEFVSRIAGSFDPNSKRLSVLCGFAEKYKEGYSWPVHARLRTGP
jgi:hypothetical protein